MKINTTNIVIKAAENRLASMEIPKKAWIGCKIEHHPPQANNSYKSAAHGTYITLERFSSGWFLVAAYRSHTGSCAYGTLSYQTLILSDVARAAIPKTFTI